MILKFSINDSINFWNTGTFIPGRAGNFGPGDISTVCTEHCTYFPPKRLQYEYVQTYLHIRVYSYTVLHVEYSSVVCNCVLCMYLWTRTVVYTISILVWTGGLIWKLFCNLKKNWRGGLEGLKPDSKTHLWK